MPLRPELDIRLAKVIKKVNEDAELLAAFNLVEPEEGEEVPIIGNRSSVNAELNLISEVITEEVGILVSDMSGFIRTVREHGIINFASIIARKRQISIPILKRRGAVNIFTEGDDMIAIFHNVLECAKAAVEMQQTIASVNELLGKGREFCTINLDGIGVHCGSGIIIDTKGNISGEPFRVAYHLGETLSADGVVLFSSAVVDRVRGDSTFAQATFREAGDEHVRAFYVVGAADLVRKDAIPAPDDSLHLEAKLLPLAKRHLPGANLATIDAEMTKRHVKPYCVLVFNLVLSRMGESTRESEILHAKFHGLKLLSRVLEKHGGRGLQDLVWLFKTPSDALLAVVEARHAVKAESEEASPGLARAEVTGYGIHFGSLFIIEGTDVHWGEPVNIASKLGQEIAKDGQILITKSARMLVASDPRNLCVDLEFSEQYASCGGMTFGYFSI